MANLNSQKKHHFIYKTTNLKNGKFYVGMHSTNDIDDGYLGSGKRLRYSIRKNGKENFKIEYLEFFDTHNELRDRERELVNEELLKDPMCMNLAIGGTGGHGNRFLTKKQIQNGGKTSGTIHSEKLKNDIEFRKKHIDWFKKMTTNLRKLGGLSPPNWTGKKHKEESKRKIGEVNSQKQKAEGNSQFGTCWITDGIENKKIKKTEKLPEGWEFGRKIKVI